MNELPKTATITKYQTRHTALTAFGVGVGLTIALVGLYNKNNKVAIIGSLILGTSYVLIDNPTYS